jgi:hypothetical protein
LAFRAGFGAAVFVVVLVDALADEVLLDFLLLPQPATASVAVTAPTTNSFDRMQSSSSSRHTRPAASFAWFSHAAICRRWQRG